MNPLNPVSVSPWRIYISLGVPRRCTAMARAIAPCGDGGMAHPRGGGYELVLDRGAQAASAAAGERAAMVAEAPCNLTPRHPLVRY